MVLLLLPSMAFRAAHAIRTASVFDTLNILVFLPKGALDRLVVVLLGVPAIVLDIVSVDAVGPVVVARYRTPDSFVGI